MTGSTDEKDPPVRIEENQVEATSEAEAVKFSPDEEKALIEESNALKTEANTLYTAKDYENALSKYGDALSTCPNYLHYERAVIQSNMAACHLQTEQWKDAIKEATKALDGLDKFEKTDVEPSISPDSDKQLDAEKEEDEAEEEIISSGAFHAAAAPSRESEIKALRKTKKANIRRIRIKALLRRGRARSEAGGWQNLVGAEEDYKTLSVMVQLSPGDVRTIRSQLIELPPRIKAAQETEMSEMWGKLKTLGDGILKPFGLSTNNFQMVRDEKSGGYSMNFTSGDGSSGPS
ncbi:hypothetical protein QQS21_007796 [Conoideocrella luteorostrata]|uniref:Tetratricopeptide repeat protein 1 n=1 Tax=Conoideocrella luteorostrata TaxID=1105319 RepID=A0AAJ0CK29_9HYPO|nr:hypothetical protein QQS21_007796 [Conoideocrella luteorostrata]